MSLHHPNLLLLPATRITPDDILPAKGGIYRHDRTGEAVTVLGCTAGGVVVRGQRGFRREVPLDVFGFNFTMTGEEA